MDVRGQGAGRRVRTLNGPGEIVNVQRDPYSHVLDAQGCRSRPSGVDRDPASPVALFYTFTFGCERFSRKTRILTYLFSVSHERRSHVNLSATHGGPSPIRAKTYGKEGRRGPFSAPFFDEIPPFSSARLETLRIILASNPPCARYRPTSRRIVRNKTGVYPGGQHCAKYGSRPPPRGRIG